MRSLSSPTLALIFSAHLSATSILAADAPQWPRGPDDLQVSLTVLSALEEGPVICKVTLKNVSDIPLRYGYFSRSNDAFCQPGGTWKLRGERLIQFGGMMGGMMGYGTRSLDPGQTESHTFDLHPKYLSIPAGDVPIDFGWNIYRLVPETRKDRVFNVKLDLLFSLRSKQVVEILPATKDNVMAALRKLEGEFQAVLSQLKGADDYWSWSPDPAYEFVQTIAGCRHKEFVPLLLRALDRLPSKQLRGELVGAVYESFATPADGFVAFVKYLERSNPVSMAEVFEFWSNEGQIHAAGKDWLGRQEVEAPREFTGPNAEKEAELDRQWRKFLEEDHKGWLTSKRHIDVRLTQNQFARLRSIKHSSVRALLYAYFPEECPAEWVMTLFQDLGRLCTPPARLRELLVLLDDDSFDVREQASAELLKADAVLASLLWDVKQEKLPPEAAQRLKHVLEELEERKVLLPWRRTFASLAYNLKPEARKILEVLAAKESSCLIARAAREALEKRREHEAPLKRLESR